MGRLASDTAPTATLRSAQEIRSLRHQALKGFVPGRKPRKSAKPLDSGAKVEHELDRLINRTGTTCWRRPGVRGTRLCGTGMTPDGAGYLSELAELKLVADHTPQVHGRSVYNFLLSYKGQRTAGSVKQKIEKEISDLGHWSDVDKIVAAVVIDMSAGVITLGELARWKRLGRQHLVAVLTRDEVMVGMLPVELVKVARARRRLYTRITPRGGYRPTKRFSLIEQAYLERASARREMRRLGCF